MAMAICSCSKQYSSAFPNISHFSSYSTTKSHLKVLIHGTPLVYNTRSSSKLCNFITVQQDDALVIPSADTGAATSPARETKTTLDRMESESDVKREYYRCNEVTLSRKRRRRRRKIRSTLECVVDEEKDDRVLFVDKKAGKSRFMTSKEEAKFSWYLKERARIEGVRIKLEAEIGGHKLSSIQWAKAAGISTHNLDKILCNGRESEERITSCYHRLVVSVASSYQGKGLSLQDLTQEGSIGLLRGAIKFNPERGYKLSTYAYWWIRQSITRALAKKSKIIRLPGSVTELVPRICEANDGLSRRLRRFPTYDEIAEAINVETSIVRLATQRNRSPISLDQAITGRGCMSLQAIIPGPAEITPEAMVMKDMLKPEIGKLLNPLCDREANILRLHYGLNGDTPRSFEEIGRLFKLSRERVRQINSTALSKLRQTRGVDDLKYFL
ncbi:hypothetical protein BUALT_Bualt01G0162200 [Buddleja alternifolia]|uniref:Sigma factor n=1 Tax=Buddleja alternifolia TaxID=168488 RepID=A0AAV6YI29_9LAMI|nr:hypothetical protein BUALT_Bualt01G0162200 [Buddleja alternifolia]